MAEEQGSRAPRPGEPVRPSPGPCCGSGIDRREFLKLTAPAVAALGALGGRPAIAGPFTPKDTADHLVPADKKLRPEWVEALFARGESTWYSGADLDTIGMPVGGICAGQVYLSGDGRLVCWDVFNEFANTGYGQVNYKVGRRPTENVRNVRDFVAAPQLDQGFAIQVRDGATTQVRTLDRTGFPGVRFCGEYPLGFVEYADEAFPMTVSLDACSPFIPLNEEDSALPATVLHYRLWNRTSRKLDVSVAGWLENRVCLHSGENFQGEVLRTQRLVRRDGVTAVLSGARLRERPPVELRPPIVLADFEGEDYGAWTVEGEAFGTAPARGTLPEQQPVSGYQGEGLINTYLGKDGPQGRLVSPPFRIERRYLSFLVGGGSQAGDTCVNLLIDGVVVRTVTGKDAERLEPCNWDVEELHGKEARLEILDRASGAWGHVNVDQIELRDEKMTRDPGELRRQADWGTLSLAVLGEGDVHASISLPDGALPAELFAASGRTDAESSEKPLSETLRGAVGRTVTLEPGATADLEFVVSWCLPNLWRGNALVGNYYTRRFRNAADVAVYIARDSERLVGDTHRWHENWYDSTLPRWLLDRVHSTVANLATTTCQWWRNGRFWAWEGGGCCHGTCGHVWNYEHALARLFPRLERSVREMQDFAPGMALDPETGAIGFRGENYDRWAGDAQGGYILKAFREHQMSAGPQFLERNWRSIRQALEFLIEQDGDGDGLIEGSQHQTYDQNYFGANTFVGSLYLGALRAAEEMASEVGEADFAERCREIREIGARKSVERLFNGEYFIQEVDLEQHPEWQYGDGCLADQLFGQGWAHQVGLGHLYPRDTVLAALRSIWRYCWAPDIGPQNEAHPPERWFAYAGEAGLFTCTWPKSQHLGQRSTRYRDEIWTGIEYQVAGHMAWEGMVTEALAICRAIHERYHPAKHNPFNEIECGDHYARALASWGVLTGLAGFELHGPRGRIGFAPRITPEDFRAAFTAPEGWGSLAQQRDGNGQYERIEVRWGRLLVRELAFELAEGTTLAGAQVTLEGPPPEGTGRRLAVTSSQEGRRVVIALERDTVVEAWETIAVTLTW